jgi:4-hydroxysphinganine ceramide fatty acyl 2-hydroxylase
MNYWAETLIDSVLAVAFMSEGLRQHDLSLTAALATILLGLLIFSFMEYCFHRWMFHGTVVRLKQGHAVHHIHPQGYDALPFFFPPLVLMGITGAFSRFLPLHLTFLLSGAIAFGYVTYGLSHFLIHHKRFHNAIARKWASHHHIHHHHPDCNFGVTTPLWDAILGTRYVAKHKQV